MAGSNYSVNIKLDTTAARKSLQTLEKRVNTLRQSLNKPLKIDTRVSKIQKEMAKSKEAQRVSMVQTRRIGTQINDLEAKGLSLEKARAAIRRAAKADSTKSLSVSKLQRSIALDEIKAAKNELRVEKEITRERLRQAAIPRGPASPIGGSLTMAGSPMALAARSQMLSGALSSAAISAAFPLLFGQGPEVAIGGGVGGLIGSAFGPMGGFAGGLIGTSIAQTVKQIVDFRKEIDLFNDSLESMGYTGDFTAEKINDLAKELNKTKDETLQLLKSFGGFDAEQRTVMADVFGDPSTFKLYASITKDANSLISALQPLIDQNEISIDQAQSILTTLNRSGLDAAVLAVERLKEQKSINDQIAEMEITAEDQRKADAVFRQYYYQDEFGRMQSYGIFEGLGEAEQKLIQQMFSPEFFKQERIDEFIANKEKELEITRQVLQLQRDLTDELERQAIIQAPADELRRLLDPLRQLDFLSKSISASFADSFKGIVSGSMTAQEALASLFRRTADAFLDMAAQILAAKVRAGIMGLFPVFNSASGVMGGAGYYDPVTGKGTAGPNFGLADGGTARAGKTYLVGERGPELFSPGVTGTVTPNEMLGGGSTSIVVNVDASGTSVEGNEANGEELGRLIGAVVQSELIKEKRPGGLLA